MKEIDFDRSGLIDLEKNLKGIDVEIDIGLFDPVEATKGFLLEYGDGEKQVARPWLSSLFNANTQSYKNVMFELIKFIQAKMDGEMVRVEDLADDFAEILKEHVYNQDYPASMPDIKFITKYLKELAGSRYVEDIGINTGDMVESIEARIREN
jgi:hypothetical protein